MKTRIRFKVESSGDYVAVFSNNSSGSRNVDTKSVNMQSSEIPIPQVLLLVPVTGIFLKKVIPKIVRIVSPSEAPHRIKARVGTSSNY